MSVSNEFLLGAGGYYRADDNSGPYFVGSDGKAIPLAGEPSGPSSVKVDDICDATKVGKALLKSKDAEAARKEIGAGTSNLELGSTSVTAAAGNHSHSAATATQAGFMSAADKAKLDAIQSGGGGGDLTPVSAPSIVVSDPPDSALLQQNFDALIGALKSAGVFK